MHMTIFYTPVFQQMLRLTGFVYLKVTGWRYFSNVEQPRKFIILAGPHTSNGDFPIMISCTSLVGARPYWMGKKDLFRFPFKTFFRWMGGLPIDRSKRNSVVDQMVQYFEEADELCLLIPPEGTRKASEQWKSGFYHIARQGNVPLILSYVDYAKKEGAFSEIFEVTGDYEADMRYIQEFYAGKAAKHPENFAGEFLTDKSSETE
jgi:1-acyl-sn-glycerol-3-phosphate acyltransferase